MLDAGRGLQSSMHAAAVFFGARLGDIQARATPLFVRRGKKRDETR
jgi:hypothetical protein